MAGLFKNFISHHSSNNLVFIPVRNHRGYLPFQGRLPTLENEDAKLRLQVQAINLKPVKRVHFKVDPLHPKSHTIRQTMSLMSHERITRTGPKTAFKFDFVSDRSEPEIKLTFLDDQDLNVLIKTANLSMFDIIFEMNKIVLPLVKEETVSTSAAGKPKKASGGGKGKKK